VALHSIIIKDFPDLIPVEKGRQLLQQVFEAMFPDGVVAVNVLGKFNKLYKLSLQLKRNKQKY